MTLVSFEAEATMGKGSTFTPLCFSRGASTLPFSGYTEFAEEEVLAERACRLLPSQGLMEDSVGKEPRYGEAEAEGFLKGDGSAQKAQKS